MEVIFISLIEKNKGERFGWGLEKSEETGFLQIIKIIDDEIADLNGFQIDDVVTKIFDLKQKEYIGLDSTRSDFRKKCDGLTNGLISMRRIVEQNASTEEDSNNEGRQIPQAPQLLPKKQKPVEVLENITRKRPLRTCVKRKLQTKTKPISNKISTSSRSYLKKIRTDSKARKAAASFHEFRKSVTPRVIGSKQSVNHNQINNDIVENSNFAALSPNFLENTLPSTSSCLPDEDTAVVSVHEEASNFSSLTGVMQNSTHNFDFAPISSFFTEPDASKSPDFSSISSTTEPNKPANEDALKFFIVDLNISHEEKREMLSCKRLKIAAKLKKIEAKNRLIQTEIETVIAKKAKYKEDGLSLEVVGIDVDSAADRCGIMLGDIITDIFDIDKKETLNLLDDDLNSKCVGLTDIEVSLSRKIVSEPKKSKRRKIQRVKEEQLDFPKPFEVIMKNYQKICPKPTRANRLIIIRNASFIDSANTTLSTLTMPKVEENSNNKIATDCNPNYKIIAQDRESNLFYPFSPFFESATVENQSKNKRRFRGEKDPDWEFKVDALDSDDSEYEDNSKFPETSAIDDDDDDLPLSAFVPKSHAKDVLAGVDAVPATVASDLVQPSLAVDNLHSLLPSGIIPIDKNNSYSLIGSIFAPLIHCDATRSSSSTEEQFLSSYSNLHTNQEIEEKRAMLIAKRLKIECKLTNLEYKNRLLEEKIETAKKIKYHLDAKDTEIKNDISG